jgi:transposase
LNNESPEGVVHMQVSTIGVDLAKSVFQVHGVDSADKVVITSQLRRKQVIDFLSKCPSSDNLRLIGLFEKGGSGSSGVRV